MKRPRGSLARSRYVATSLSWTVTILLLLVLVHFGKSDGYNHNSAYQNQKYYYQKQADRIEDNYHNKNPTFSQLTDVLFCLFMALGWTVWMLSSFIRNELFVYQQDSILVKGNVLQCMMTDPTLKTYKAVVDYKVVASSQGATAATSNTVASPSVLQIRKHFETNQKLKQGFHNVDVLVLPHEPTHSVLREDWEMEVEESKLEQPCWETSCFKRISIAFAGLMVLFSVAGSILMVEKLPPQQYANGWIVVCSGITLLLPMAILVHRGLVYVQRSLDSQSHQAGVVIQPPPNKETHEQHPLPQHPYNNKNTPSSAAFNVSDCDNLDILDVRVCDDDLASLDIQQSIRQTTASAGCYWIELPQHKKHSNDNDSVLDSSAASIDQHSSVSSISLDRENSYRSNHPPHLPAFRQPGLLANWEQNSLLGDQIIVQGNHNEDEDDVPSVLI